VARRASRVCPIPGCANLVPPGRARYCPPHERARQARVDAQRPTSAQRGYDGEWQRIRAVYLGEHPYCAECGAPATDVHHITPLRRGGTHDETNLKALCHACHSRVTARRDGGFGNPSRRR